MDLEASPFSMHVKFLQRLFMINLNVSDELILMITWLGCALIVGRRVFVLTLRYDTMTLSSQRTLHTNTNMRQNRKIERRTPMSH